MELPELLQDVIRCDLCETPVPSRHCDICHLHLCEECEIKHISDESKEHVIVSFDFRGSTPKCSKHSTETCARYCKKCDTRICALCVSSGKHKRHKTMRIFKMADDKKEPLKNDLKTTVKLRCNTSICAPCISSGKDKHHKTEETSKMSDGKREPRKNNFQTTAKCTLPKKARAWITILSFICHLFLCCFDSYVLSCFVDQYSKNDRWLIVFVLLFFVELFQYDFVMFCLRLVCGDPIDIGIFNLFFEYLKWLITRIKAYRKNDLQTINFTVHKIEIGCRIMSFFIGYVIGICLFWVPGIYLLRLNVV